MTGFPSWTSWVRIPSPAVPLTSSEAVGCESAAFSSDSDLASFCPVVSDCQYAVWGIWLPYLANYLTAAPDKGGLGFTGAQMGWILGLAGSIGALAAPEGSGSPVGATQWLCSPPLRGALAAMAKGAVT